MLEPWLGLPQRVAHFTSNLNFHLRFSLRVFFLFHFQPSVSVARSPCIHLTSSDLPDTATYCTPSSYGGGLNYTRAYASPASAFKSCLESDIPSDDSSRAGIETEAQACLSSCNESRSHV